MKFFRKLGRPPFLKEIAYIFDRRVRRFGETPAGVLWKNSEGQQLRFEILAGIIDDLALREKVTVNDFGCGYGAMYDFLEGLPGMADLTYTGYDIAEEMIATAWHRTRGRQATFIEASKIDQAADFTFVSGTFNLKLEVADIPWNAFVKSNLAALWPKSKKALAFNMLDKNHPVQGKDLYYADSNDFMDFCRTLSANVTLIDDYPLHEWTIFLRR
ncbi:MAG: class I SAM-dependent methyltransferase [Rhodospirillales bacterium]|nr:class I SAM-dependent methyltransferase [Rhodospirillales bacterium]